jgi:MFS family permease
VGYAAMAPVQGRLVDRYGQTVPLTATVSVCVAAFAGLLLAAAVDAASLVLAVLAAVAGMSLPPVAAAQRSLWSVVLPDAESRQTALAVDSMVLDLGLIVGPLIVSGVAVVASPEAAVATTAAMLLTGTLWFSRLEPSRQQRGASRQRDMVGALRSPGTRTLVVGATLTGVVLGALNVGFVAVAEDHGADDLGGVLIALFGIGSLLGGLVYGARSWPGDPANRWITLLAGYTVGLLALAAASWSLPAIAVVAIAAGSMLTPQVVAEFELIPRCAPPSSVTEAYAWGITATFAGAALCNAVGGSLAEEGARLPLLTCVAGAALATLVAWFWRHTLVPPDAEPIEASPGAGDTPATHLATEEA